jgi:hypothetical protein
MSHGKFFQNIVSAEAQKRRVKIMNKNLLAEQVRQHDQELGEALEENLFSPREVADQLRFMAADEPPVSNRFFSLMALARKVEEI